MCHKLKSLIVAKDSALWRSNEVIALVRKSISQKSFIIFD